MSGQQADIEEILSRRHDNGAGYWATPDGRIYVGNPFSTVGSLSLLHELKVTSDHEAASGGLDVILDVCRFYYVYVHSFFPRATSDPRFLEAVRTLDAKLDGQGQVVVERPHRDLKRLRFCAKGVPSSLATGRYRELRCNLEAGSGRRDAS